MASIERSTQTPTPSGVKAEPIMGLSTADVQLIPNNGKTTIRVTNGGAEATAVTIITPREVGGNPIADKQVTVAAGETTYIGDLAPKIYNNRNERIELKLSKATGVSLEIIRA